MILFGALGFNFAITRIKLKSHLLAATVFFNLLIISLAYYLLADPFSEFLSLVSLFIFALFTSIAGIILFSLLFQGDYQKYFLYTFINSLLLLSIIPLLKYTSIGLMILFPVVAFLWLLSIIVIARPFQNNNSEDIRGFYILGVSAFVINGTASLAFALDKYFVNHFYDVGTANSYTFSWSLVAPIFYIGTLVEKNIYALNDGDAKSTIKKSFFALAGSVLLYGFVVLAIIKYFNALLPSSIQPELLLTIFTLMIIGYGLYAMIHFPINGYLFKYAETFKQTIISKAIFIATVPMFALYYFILSDWFKENFTHLIIGVLAYIFLIQIIKVFILFYNNRNYEASLG